jgi:predicted metallo-beta-lactamase superfamily hydrolase
MAIQKDKEYTDLLERIRRLPEEQLVEVRGLVERLLENEDRELEAGFRELSQEAFRRVWDNPEDAAYDHV